MRLVRLLAMQEVRNQQRRMANRASWLPGLPLVTALSSIADFGFMPQFAPPPRPLNAPRRLASSSQGRQEGLSLFGPWRLTHLQA